MPSKTLAHLIGLCQVRESATVDHRGDSWITWQEPSARIGSDIISVSHIWQELLIPRLPDGSSISTLTALLLQLIQAASHGVGSRIRKLRSSRLDLEGIGSPQPEQPNLADEVGGHIERVLTT